MEIYFILAIITLIMTIIESEYTYFKLGNNLYKVKNVSYYLITGMLLFIGCLRNEFNGFDLENYYNNYFIPSWNGSIKYYIMNWGFDIGYFIWNWIISLITHDFYYYLVITYIVTIMPIAILVKKKSDNVAFSYLIFVFSGLFYTEFYLLRFGLAISALLWAYLLYIKHPKKWILFLGCLISFCIHGTLVVSFFFLFLPLFRKMSNWFRVGILIMFPIGFAFISNYLLAWYKTDYSVIKLLGNGIEMLILYMGLIMINEYFKYHRKKEKSQNSIEEEMTWTLLYFQACSPILSLISRLTFIGWIAAIIAFPKTASDLDYKTRRTFSFSMILILSVKFYLTYITMIPYKFHSF